MDDRLQSLRSDIDRIDDQLLRLLAERMDLSAQMGRLKRELHLQPLQPRRFQQLLTRLKAQGADIGLSADFVERLWQVIHDESLRHQ